MKGGGGLLTFFPLKRGIFETGESLEEDLQYNSRQKKTTTFM